METPIRYAPPYRPFVWKQLLFAFRRLTKTWLENKGEKPPELDQISALLDQHDMLVRFLWWLENR